MGPFSDTFSNIGYSKSQSFSDTFPQIQWLALFFDFSSSIYIELILTPILQVKHTLKPKEYLFVLYKIQLLFRNIEK
ncbi:hypothetical protein PGRAT_31020 [Paenibacillus graminis]|uniref:Uncharacterized protein n=1 Tax=Paenibacillus graminis TaxID=189425 RepID=A0A089NR12_9BACL|nr:hypothetical protein PGRAT_31020 [Paenibacillus graminis]